MPIRDNSGFARAAYEFGQSHNSSREVSPVITDFSIANIAWLKSPMTWTQLPEIETLAACFAALEPNAGDWRQYLSKLDELSSKGSLNPDEHALLRVSPVSRVDIMYLVRDSGDVTLAGGTVREIVDRVKSGLVAEKEKELAALREEQAEHASKQNEVVIGLTTKQEMAMQALRDERDAIVRRQNEQAEQLEVERKARKQLTSRIATWIVNTLILTPLALFIGIGLAGGSGLLAPFDLNIEKSTVLFVIVCAVCAIGTFSILLGTSFLPIRLRATNWVEKKLNAVATSNKA
jgi:hypothetical protein